MSENTVVVKDDGPQTDISDGDMVKVKDYMEQGLPGVAAVNDEKLTKMLDLYLSGSTYWQISNALNIKRPVILYLSHRFKWFDAKQEYLTELDRQIKGRVISAKLVSQDFLLQLTQMWQKKIGSKVKKYLATDNPEHADEINLKEVSQYLKTMEMLVSLGSDGKDSKGRNPAVGLNLGDGVTIEKTGENTVTITPKEKIVTDILKQYADMRREEDNKISATKRSDREGDVVNETGEKSNEDK